jgi:hypothetical protein
MSMQDMESDTASEEDEILPKVRKTCSYVEKGEESPSDTCSEEDLIFENRYGMHGITKH